MTYISKSDIEKLKKIRETMTMENASFSMDITEDRNIKEKTRIWRETWILPPLDTIIKKLEERANKGRKYK